MKDMADRAFTRLQFWEEVLGPFQDLAEEDGMLIATIANINVIFPLEMKDDLEPLLGQRIGVLRTDDSLRPYRVRVIPGLSAEVVSPGMAKA